MVLLAFNCLWRNAILFKVTGSLHLHGLTDGQTHNDSTYRASIVSRGKSVEIRPSRCLSVCRSIPTRFRFSHHRTKWSHCIVTIQYGHSPLTAEIVRAVRTLTILFDFQRQLNYVHFSCVGVYLRAVTILQMLPILHNAQLQRYSRITSSKSPQ